MTQTVSVTEESRAGGDSRVLSYSETTGLSEEVRRWITSRTGLQGTPGFHPRRHNGMWHERWCVRELVRRLA